MKTVFVPVGEAAGRVVCQNIRGRDDRGYAFRKGHILQEADLALLEELGLSDVYVLELEPGDVHEDEAGWRLALACAGEGVEARLPKESRSNLVARQRGLLYVDVPNLEALNLLPDVSVFTLPNHETVEEGEVVAGAKVVPLVVAEQDLRQAEAICSRSRGVVSVRPFLPLRTGVLVRGQGKIASEYEPVVRQKMAGFGSEVIGYLWAPEELEAISAHFAGLLEKGAELILTAGGQSGDPEDLTLRALLEAGGRLERRGVPAHPGSTFWLGYRGEVPVLGVSSCGVFSSKSVLERILPRLLTGERLTSADLARYGCGGLLSRG